MSDNTPEKVSDTSGLRPVSRRIFVPSPNTNWGKIESRQADIDGVLSMSDDPEKRAKEINALATKWDDETGLSFLHILGVELPGLEIHGVAKGLVISASHLIEPDFRGADLEASVFSASVLSDLRATNANLAMSIWSLARVNGDMSGADAVDSNFNLAQLQVAMKRTRLLGSFMIGTKGLTSQNVREADFRHVTFLPKTTGGRSRRNTSNILKSALSARFLDAREGGETTPVRYAEVYTDMQARSALQSGAIAEGQAWVGGDLSDSRLVGAELNGSVLDDVGLQRVRATELIAAGLITLLCSMDGMDATHSWAPGSVHIYPSLNDAIISGGNWAGSVLVDPSLRDIAAVRTNMDGAVIISDKPQNQLVEQVKGRITVISAAELSTPVNSLLTAAANVKNVSSGASAPKQIENN